MADVKGTLVKGIIIVSILVLLFLVGGLYYMHEKHHVNAELLTTVDCDVEVDGDYYMLRNLDEINHFNEQMGTEVVIPEDFNFDKNCVLVCEGHKLIDSYYSILDEGKIINKTHFLYVVLRKEKESKVYMYTIPENYTTWMFSERYEEGEFTGIIYE